MIDALVRFELDQLFAEADAAARDATTLEDLLCVGIGVALRRLAEHKVLQYLLAHEPEAILPHVAFHRLAPVLAAATEMSRPYLALFLADDQVAAAAELATRLVLSFTFNPSPAVGPHDPDTIRRLVRIYLLPAFASEEAP